MPNSSCLTLPGTVTTMTSVMSSCRRGPALPQGPKYDSPKQRPSLRNIVLSQSVLTPVELNRTYHDVHLPHPSPKRDSSADGKPAETDGSTLSLDRRTVANSSMSRTADRRRQRRQQQRQDSTLPHGEKQSENSKSSTQQTADDITYGNKDNMLAKDDKLATYESDDDGVHNEEDVCSVDDEDSSSGDNDDGNDDDDNERKDGDSTSSDDAVGDSWRSDMLSPHCRIGECLTHHADLLLSFSSSKMIAS